MDDDQNEIDDGNSRGWAQKFTKPEKLLGERELTEWLAATAAVREFALGYGVSRPQVATLSGVPAGTLYSWYDGTYRGSYANITARMQVWLAAEQEKRATRQAMLREPGWVETRTARRVSDALLYAQEAPGIAVVTLGPGMGKTMTAHHVAATRPHVWRVVMRPTTSNVGPMLREIAGVLGVGGGTNSSQIFARAIGEKLKRNGRHTLLIVDEAQNLADLAIDELRHILDEFGVGIGLLGNEDLHRRIGGMTPRDGYGQLHRRIDVRIRQLAPLKEDIDAYIDAWGIADKAVERLLATIGRKPGALGQISKTLRYAAILAAGRGGALSADDVRAAWLNRSGEELR